MTTAHKIAQARKATWVPSRSLLRYGEVNGGVQGPSKTRAMYGRDLLGNLGADTVDTSELSSRLQFRFQGFLGELLGAGRRRAGEGESGRPGARRTTLQIPITSALVCVTELVAQPLQAGTATQSLAFKELSSHSQNIYNSKLPIALACHSTG
eukprot:1157302-Pelagomonas_calceolata.AAC.33